MSGITGFVSGTSVLTKNGNKAVEDLHSGDHVQTVDAGFQPIKWIGSSVMKMPALIEGSSAPPVCISACSIAEELPHDDLVICANHKVLVRAKIIFEKYGVEEIFTPAFTLVGLPGISYQRKMEPLKFYSILLERHEIVYANGLPSESLFLNTSVLKDLSSDQVREIKTAFIDFKGSLCQSLPARPQVDRGKKRKRFISKIVKNTEFIDGEMSLIKKPHW